MKGRKPMDVKMKLLTGNLRGKPPAEDADPFTCEPVDEPEGLDELAAQEWHRLTTSLAPVLSKSSAGMVLAAATAYADMITARKVLTERGTTYEAVSKSGDILLRPRPEVAILQNARRQYISSLAELGASPVSRSRVRRLPEKKTAKQKRTGTGAYFT